MEPRYQIEAGNFQERGRFGEGPGQFVGARRNHLSEFVG